MITLSCSIYTSFCGVLLVSLSDSQVSTRPVKPTSPIHAVPTIAGHPERALLGDSLALLSAVFYALYVILLKVRIRSESRINMQLFFGFVGLFNLLACWPIGLLLHFFEVEKFEWPIGWKEIGALVINVSLTPSH
jgi:solute carrier family 35 protein F5